MINIATALFFLLAAIFISGAKKAKNQVEYITADKQTKTFPLVSTLVMTEINPMALISMSALGYLAGYWALWMAFNRSNIFYSLASGIFIVLNWIFLFKSFQLASITIGNVSYYLQPIFLVILGILFFQESVRNKQWFYIILTTIGIMLTSNPHGGMMGLNLHMIAGIGCAVIAGLLYAFATILVKFIKDMPPALITLIQLSAGCTILILMPFMSLSDIAHLNTQVLLNVMVIGIVHTALAYILYYQSLTQVNLTLVAVLSYIDPIVAIITDILFCYRTLNGLQIIGILLTFIGSYQVIRLKKVRQTHLPESLLTDSLNSQSN